QYYRRGKAAAISNVTSSMHDICMCHRLCDAYVCAFVSTSKRNSFSVSIHIPNSFIAQLLGSTRIGWSAYTYSATCLFRVDCLADLAHVVTSSKALSSSRLLERKTLAQFMTAPCRTSITTWRIACGMAF